MLGQFEVRYDVFVLTDWDPLLASFQILHFLSKPDACNSFLSPSSDAAHRGAARAHLELWSLCCTPSYAVPLLLALGCVTNDNVRVMTGLQHS